MQSSTTRPVSHAGPCLAPCTPHPLRATRRCCPRSVAQQCCRREWTGLITCAAACSMLGPSSDPARPLSARRSFMMHQVHMAGVAGMPSAAAAAVPATQAKVTDAE